MYVSWEYTPWYIHMLVNFCKRYAITNCFVHNLSQGFLSFHTSIIYWNCGYIISFSIFNPTLFWNDTIVHFYLQISLLSGWACFPTSKKMKFIYYSRFMNLGFGTPEIFIKGCHAIAKTCVWSCTVKLLL